MTQPAYKGNGTYGCVFRPGVLCPKKNNIPNDNLVSKVFKTDSSYKEENIINEQILKNVDSKYSFTVEPIAACVIDKKEIDRNQMSKCNNFSDAEKNRSKLPQILYEYGGQDLTNAVRFFSFEEMFLAFKRAFEGLVIMAERGYAHMDIKPANMVYNNENNKLSIIDFGLTRKYGSIYALDGRHLKNQFIFKHRYPYYPPEFIAIYNKYTGDNIDINQNHRSLVKIMSALSSYTASNDIPIEIGKLISQSYVMTGLKEFLLDNGGDKETLRHAVIKYQNKIDVFMLGASLIDILNMCCVHKTANMNVNTAFYVELLRLIRKMVDYSPETRIDAQGALQLYKKVAKMITKVPTSPAKPSPLKIKRPDTKPLSPHKKVCPPGKVLNPMTNRCINVREPKVAKDPKECPPGKVLNPITNRCIKARQDRKVNVPKVPEVLKEDKENQTNECPAGMVYKCVKVSKAPKVEKENKPKECPPGKVLNPVTNRCIKPPP